MERVKYLVKKEFLGIGKGEIVEFNKDAIKENLAYGWTVRTCRIIEKYLGDYLELYIEPANTKTIQALKDSEAHWLKDAYLPLLKGDKPEGMGSDSCALCAIFNSPKLARCDGCPLSEAGMRCGRDRDDPFTNYHANRCAQTAWDMAKAIRTCREQLEGEK